MKRFSRLLFLTGFFLTPLAGVGAQEPSDPLAPPDVLRPVPEKYSDANRIWQGIASLEVAKDGGLWASWYSGGATECGENYVLLAHSADQGAT